MVDQSPQRSETESSKMIDKIPSLTTDNKMHGDMANLRPMSAKELKIHHCLSHVH